MKLTPTGASAPVAQPLTDRAAATCAGLTARTPAADVAVGAQAMRVQAAQAQLSELPEVDLQRVQEIKQALARGEIQFDPEKLAALVQRHHGGGR